MHAASGASGTSHIKTGKDKGPVVNARLLKLIPRGAWVTMSTAWMNLFTGYGYSIFE